VSERATDPAVTTAGITPTTVPETIDAVDAALSRAPAAGSTTAPSTTAVLASAGTTAVVTTAGAPAVVTTAGAPAVLTTAGTTAVLTTAGTTAVLTTAGTVAGTLPTTRAEGRATDPTTEPTRPITLLEDDGTSSPAPAGEPAAFADPEREAPPWRTVGTHDDDSAVEEPLSTRRIVVQLVVGIVLVLAAVTVGGTFAARRLA
jgi:hypothetical protein